MGQPSDDKPQSSKPPQAHLDSWKEIAAYLNRDVTTVQRWEKREGMPVRRHRHGKLGSVYALRSELDAWLQSRNPEAQKEPNEPAQQPAFAAEASSAAQRRARLADSRHLLRWLVLAALACFAVFTFVYLITRNHSGQAARPKIQSLAVLPLKNLSDVPSQDYLADGMTDALIGRLAQIHELRVVSRTSVMRFKNPQLSVPEIAKTLGVDAIVEGSVMRDGNRIRVTAQLIRADTDTHLWSESYDRELRDVLGLESDIAQAIAERVEVTITGAELQRLKAARQVSPEVYESYLRGWYALNNGYTKAGKEESVRYFQQTIDKDPTFAPAYVGLADAYDELGTVFLGGQPDSTRSKVIDAAQKALELDPSLAEPHVLLGEIAQRQWHWAEAQAEFRRAIALDPNEADAYGALANWMLCQGRTEEALDWQNRGRQIDPLAIYGPDVGWLLFQSRRYNDAIQVLQDVLAVKPNDAAAMMYLGFTLAADNQPQKAIPLLEKGLAISKGSPAIIGVLIGAYARAGRRKDALRLLAELQKRKKSGYVPAAAFVNAYVGLGDNDQAFAWLDQACQEQSNILQFLKVHPWLDPLRHDPRFAALLHRVGLA